MELSNEFTVDVPVERAWAVLTDVELIAPCLPGAQLQEVAGEEYRGIVKVKVGPITAQYKGAATFQEKDENARRIVLKAEGRDTRGQGNASATITAVLESADSATKVRIDTDLNITGKVAQFGRGVMADVSAKLLSQFVESLEREVLSAPAPAAPSETTASAPPPSSNGATRPIEHRAAEPVDLLDAAGGAVMKRLVPAVIAALLVLFLLRRRRR
jgi:carbon monoxide dehydrogenase subunit G